MYNELQNKSNVSISTKNTLLDVLSAIGVNDQYIRNAFNDLDTRINSFSTGLIELSSGGGPIVWVVLFKFSNDYWQAELFTYSRYMYSIIRIAKSDNDYYGAKFN